MFFSFLSRNFWLIAIVICVINAVAYHIRFRAFCLQHPERARGYQQFLLGFILINVLVWATMGLGIMVGGVSSVFAYFNPSAGHPYVLAWHGLLIALWVIGIVWVFFRGGAQFIVDHPGLLNFTPSSPRIVQLWFGVCILGGVLGEVFMWLRGGTLPIP